MTPPTYPARPVNGGPLDAAAPKHGVWLYEPKFNGWRALVHRDTGAMFNRHGEPLTIQDEFKTALTELQAILAADAGKLFATSDQGGQIIPAEALAWADVEALERRHNRGRGSLVVLDLPLLRLPCAERGYVLRQLFCPAIDHCAANNTVYSVPQYTDGPHVYADAKADNQMLGCEFYEGVVAKRADSLYPLQLRSAKTEFPFWMKHRWAW